MAFNSKIINDLVLNHKIDGKKATVKEVAKAIGLTITTLYSENPTVKTLQTIADYFNVDVTTFFGSEAPMRPVIDDSVSAYKKLVKTQEDLILKQEKMYEKLERDNTELRAKIAQLEKDKSSVTGYSIAAEKSPKLDKKKHY